MFLFPLSPPPGPSVPCGGMTAGMSKKEQIKLVAKRKAFGPKGPQGKKMKKPRAQAPPPP